MANYGATAARGDESNSGFTAKGIGLRCPAVEHPQQATIAWHARNANFEMTVNYMECGIECDRDKIETGG